MGRIGIVSRFDGLIIRFHESEIGLAHEHFNGVVVEFLQRGEDEPDRVQARIEVECLVKGLLSIRFLEDKSRERRLELSLTFAPLFSALE